MLEFTLGTIFGFVAGCSLKDFIMSKLSNYNKSYSQKSPIKLNSEKLNVYNGERNETVADGEGFNLCSIQSTFEKYGVDLVGTSSFSILLDTIERDVYKKTLIQFSTSIHTPEDLVLLIDNGNTYKESLQIQQSAKCILLSEKNINQILERNGIDISAPTSIEDKVQSIVSFYVLKGLNQFKKTMGTSLEQFLSDFKNQKDVTILFEGIMKNINKALDFLS